jgi:hypothetical protein
VLLSASVVAGCATLTVDSHLARDVDMRSFRTFDWALADTASTGDPRLDNNRFFDERVRRQVETELTRRGFERGDSNTPQLMVHYHMKVGQRFDMRTMDHAYGYCEAVDCRPDVYDAGTLVVDLVDPRSNRLIWRGWAEGSFEGVIDNQEWLEKRIDETVARIMDRLPARL